LNYNSDYRIFIACQGEFLVFSKGEKLNILCYGGLLEDEFQTCYRAIKGVKGLIYKFDILKLLHRLKKVIPETFFIWQIHSVM
jgi:hypothetical protein